MEKIPMKNSAIKVIASKRTAQEKGVKDPYIESRIKAKSNGSKAQSFKDWGDKNPVKKAIVQLADPTGVSSYGDVKKAFNDKKINSDDIIAPLSAIPVVGRIPKVISKGLQLAKGVTTTMKIASAAQKVNNVTSKTNKVAKTVSRLEAGEAVASKLIKK
jgi:hypothetical protein